MICKAFLSLGSNMGDKEKYLTTALKKISQLNNICLKNVSNIYETEPVGYTDQDGFLNLAAAVDVGISPQAFLQEMQNIESCLERERIIKWGPRTIDIDILTFGDRTLSSLSLTIPHPMMFERAFVLIPLRDIYDNQRLFGKDIESLIEKCSDKNGVKLYRKLSVDDI